MQELFFSGAIGSFPAYNEAEQRWERKDRSGRATAYLLFRNTTSFLLRNHRSEPELAVPVAQGSSLSAFCLVPYGQAGGYGGR